MVFVPYKLDINNANNLIALNGQFNNNSEHAFYICNPVSEICSSQVYLLQSAAHGYGKNSGLFDFLTDTSAIMSAGSDGTLGSDFEYVVKVSNLQNLFSNTGFTIDWQSKLHTLNFNALNGI